MFLYCLCRFLHCSVFSDESVISSIARSKFPIDLRMYGFWIVDFNLLNVMYKNKCFQHETTVFFWPAFIDDKSQFQR